LISLQVLILLMHLPFGAKILATAHSPLTFVPQNLRSLLSSLWDSLLELDFLSSSTASVLHLLAALLAAICSKKPGGPPAKMMMVMTASARAPCLAAD
jgi:hypothetical protein